MRSAYLALDFDTGPKYVPISISGNVASFKNPGDIQYARALIESWQNLNMSVTEAGYMDQQKRVFKMSKMSMQRTLEEGDTMRSEGMYYSSPKRGSPKMKSPTRNADYYSSLVNTRTASKKSMTGRDVEVFHDQNGKLHYIGQAAGGLANGKGQLFHENGTLEYEGMFKNNQLHGKGILYNRRGKIKYQGNFRNGLKEGKGMSYYRTGTPNYEGEWLEDVFYGYGSLYNIHGELEYEGVFVNGEPQASPRKQDMSSVRYFNTASRPLETHFVTVSPDKTSDGNQPIVEIMRPNDYYGNNDSPQVIRIYNTVQSPAPPPPAPEPVKEEKPDNSAELEKKIKENADREAELQKEIDAQKAKDAENAALQKDMDAQKAKDAENAAREAALKKEMDDQKNKTAAGDVQDEKALEDEKARRLADQDKHKEELERLKADKAALEESTVIDHSNLKDEINKALEIKNTLEKDKNAEIEKQKKEIEGFKDTGKRGENTGGIADSSGFDDKEKKEKKGKNVGKLDKGKYGAFG